MTHASRSAQPTLLVTCYSLVHIRTILVLFILLASIYSIITPIFEASDELWHYPMVQWLSKGNPLPVQDAKNVGPWKQEASQPPLYYYLTGWATFWIDTSDMAVVRVENPHVDNGVITPDGNLNLVVHNPDREAFPWRGTVLAVHLIRFLSVLMGAITVWLTYHIALELFPDRSYLALGAAAINAFTPMFVFISGAINNDNLIMMLCSLSLLLMIKRLRHGEGLGIKDQGLGRSTSSPLAPRFSFSIGRWLPLGMVLGLALLTKTSALGLLPITAITVSIVAWRKRSWSEFFAGAIATAVPALLIAGWWYLRNIQLYGDVLGLSAFIDVLGRRAAPASLLQLWGERWGFMLSYWGLFGGVNVPLANWVYHVLNAFAVLAFIGAIIYLVRLTVDWFRADPVHSWRDFTYELRDYIQGRTPLFSVGLFGLTVVASLTQWASITWSSQGRLVFSAISTWSIFFALGLATIFGSRLSRLVIAATSVFMFLITLAAPFTTIAPAYARILPLQSIPSPTVSFDVTFNHQLKLIGAERTASTAPAYPGGSIELTLYWQAIAPIDKDYSTFVHLLDANEIVVAQRDMFPGQGLWPTSQMKVGDIIPSRYVINLPATAYAPDQLIFEVGVYDYASQTRLRMLDDTDNVRFGSIDLQSGADAVPNPITYNFGDQIDLIGYSIDRRTAAPNESLHLTLYWLARSNMLIDYTVFTHILEPPQTIWAQQDKPLSPPPSSWTIGQPISQTYDLQIKPDAPSGVYEIEVGLYNPTNFDRLRLVTADGRITDNFVLLSKVRVR
jgi:4-amino-4-deoxy-L-arabinose transferase-like glycosyltransferase